MESIYLNQRSKEILALLLENTEAELSIKKLAEHYQVSERSVRYDLKNIDYFLKEQGLSELKRNIKTEITLYDNQITSDEQTKKLLSTLRKDNYVYTPEERKDFIYMELLKENRTTIEQLAKLLRVSRSTINSDLIKLRKDLEQIELGVNFSNKNGLVIEGIEEEIRRKAFDTINNHPNYIHSFEQELSRLIEKNEPANEIYSNYFEKIVEEVETVAGKTYTEQSFHDLVNKLIIVIYRMKKNKYIHNENTILAALDYTTEFTVLKNEMKNVEKKYSFSIPTTEILFLTDLFLGGNLLRANDYLSEDWLELHIFVNELIESVSNKLHVDLSVDYGLFDALVLHLGPAFRRMQNKTYHENKLLDYIKDNYKELYSIVSESLADIRMEDMTIFSEDEIGYIILHVASSLEKLSPKNSKLNVLIVCNSSLGTAKLIESKIKRYFDFAVTDTIAERELDNYLSENKIDLIISTINLETSIPTIKVSPLLNSQEILEIRQLEYQILLHHKKNNITQAFVKQNVNISEDSKPMLKELLVSETVNTNVGVSNWEEAIKRGGKLLADNGYIEESYIDAMINSVKELGPYIVIAPGIAMPHARGEDGVNKIGFSLITLEEPVNFGHEKHDPVSIVVCLAATDHSTHLRALSDLVTYLNDEVFIQFLKETDSPEEVIKYINEERE